MSKRMLYIFCGKMASGKSTLARQIATDNSLFLISEDALLGALYPGEITDVESYVQFSGRLKTAIKPLLLDLLCKEISIVLDFPANTINQRKWLWDIAVEAGAQCQFHYLDISHSICKAQLAERAAKEPERHATDTAEMFDAITQYFEPPSSDEGFDIVVHKRT